MWRELRFRLYPASASRSVRTLSCLVLVLIVGLDWLDQTQVHERLTYPAISDAGCDAVCARLYALIGTRHGNRFATNIEHLYVIPAVTNPHGILSGYSHVFEDGLNG